MKAPLVLIVLALAACTERPADTTEGEAPGSGVFDPLTGTLERAADVERQVLDSAEQRRRQLEQLESP